jgi:branched-chain amino acid transport system substrate-binding protein
MKGTLLQSLRLVCALLVGVGCKRGDESGNAADKASAASDATIKIGQTMPYSGPASAYGTIGKVETAFFKKLNEEGGINGHHVDLISVDDGYNPAKAVEQVRRLVEQDHVLFIFQSLGTPSNAAVQPYLNSNKVPQLFAATGATRWGDPEHFPWTMGYNPSYRLEGATYGKYIAANQPTAKIAVLYQNDDYGKDMLKGLKDGLGTKVKDLVAEATYEVSDATIDSQIATLQASGADTFVNVTTPKFAAQAIRKVYDIGWKPTQYLSNVAASVGSVLTPAGIDKSIGINTVGYFKDPTDKQWDDDPAMKEWRAFMKQYAPDASLTDASNVYAYLAAQTLVQVLKQCSDDLTRANVMKQAANLKGFAPGLLLPGITLDTGPNDYFPFDKLVLARFDGTTWAPIGEGLSARTLR